MVFLKVQATSLDTEMVIFLFFLISWNLMSTVLPVGRIWMFGFNHFFI
jgi:hypothetical protein